MKKRIVAVITLTLALLMLFYACGNVQTETSTSKDISSTVTSEVQIIVESSNSQEVEDEVIDIPEGVLSQYAPSQFKTEDATWCIDYIDTEQKYQLQKWSKGEKINEYDFSSNINFNRLGTSKILDVDSNTVIIGITNGVVKFSNESFEIIVDKILDPTSYEHGVIVWETTDKKGYKWNWLKGEEPFVAKENIKSVEEIK